MESIGSLVQTEAEFRDTVTLLLTNWERLEHLADLVCCRVDQDQNSHALLYFPHMCPEIAVPA